MMHAHYDERSNMIYIKGRGWRHMSKEDIDRLEKSVNSMASAIGKLAKQLTPAAPTPDRASKSAPAPAHDSNGNVDREELYEYFKSRLIEDAPRLLNVIAAVPELTVTEEIKTIQASTTGKGALLGRLAMFVADGFFDKPQSGEAVRDELKRFGLVAQKTYANVTYGQNMKQLVDWGFLRVEGNAFQANPQMKKHIKKA